MFAECKIKRKKQRKQKRKNNRKIPMAPYSACGIVRAATILYLWQVLLRPIIATLHKQYAVRAISTACFRLLGELEVESDPPGGWKGWYLGDESVLHNQCQNLYCSKSSSLRHGAIYRSTATSFWIFTQPIENLIYIEVD